MRRSQKNYFRPENTKQSSILLNNLTMNYTIIEEEEFKKLISIPLALEAIEACFKEKKKGTFFAHAKYNIKGKNGDLRITPGESENQQIIGFRLYDVIRKDYSDQEQLNVVYDNKTGYLKGIIISQLLGAYRTAAINTVIQKACKKQHFETLGIIGTGFQAQIHTAMFQYALQAKRIIFYGRNQERALAFQSKLSQELGIELELRATKEEVFHEADALLLATNSSQAILDNYNFPKGVTITTIGPKLQGKSEVSTYFAEQQTDRILTDSIEQIQSYADRFFVQKKSIQDYAHLEHPPRLNDKECILICSVGMGGTEVALANAIIEKKKNISTYDEKIST